MSAEEPTTAPAAGEEESTATFEPVVRLSETVEVKTHEEDEEALFKMYAHLRLHSCAPERALAAGRRGAWASDGQISLHRRSNKPRLAVAGGL